MKDQYTCIACGGTFDKADDDKAAVKRAFEKHGPIVFQEPVVVVCDDCFKKIEKLEAKMKQDGTWVYPEN